ncbi:hypothetical protein LOC67_05900 [Stieleria sp. JC731]|uniref:hypothetical protein n=1 Tax=Pirellulaceae TaxID=2691357 RepID=UPI001E63F161|nr:hypothetical protein [Stieleria sp. JC731]MCC9600085.1 hypothetical protein [Stieleria sp. JC731]
MSVWDWYQNHAERLEQNPDANATDWIMFELFAEATEAEDPAIKLIYYREAKDSALACGDKAFALWCDAWIGMETCSAGLYGESLQGLMKAAVEARRSEYDGLPQQIMVNVLTIDRMGDIDPHGYLNEIEKGVEYLESICKEEPEHGCVYWSNMASVYTEIGLYDQAASAVERLLHSVQRYPGYDYYSSACMRMAVLQSCLGQWQAVADLAAEGLRNPPKPSAHVTLVLARARALLHFGDVDAAQAAFRQCGGPLSRCHPSSLNYDFIAAFQEEAGHIDDAITVRENQYRDTEGKGRFWERSKSSLELTRLYTAKGESRKAEYWAEQTRQSSKDLRSPKPLLSAVNEIAEQL